MLLIQAKIKLTSNTNYKRCVFNLIKNVEKLTTALITTTTTIKATAIILKSTTGSE